MSPDEIDDGQEGMVNPEEFEDAELPGGTEEESEASEFEEPEFQMAGSFEISDELLQAKAELEQRLILNIVEQTLSTTTGTSQYGFENIMGVGVGEKEMAGQPTG